MHNKYLYSFQKDACFRGLCILSLTELFFCLILFCLITRQNLALIDMQGKKALIARIPEFQAKLARPKTVVKDLSMTLNGIIYKGQPMAVINNTFVKLGGKIDGKEVTVIRGHSVTLCDIKSTDKCITLL